MILSQPTVIPPPYARHPSDTAPLHRRPAHSPPEIHAPPQIHSASNYTKTSICPACKTKPLPLPEPLPVHKNTAPIDVPCDQCPRYPPESPDAPLRPNGPSSNRKSPIHQTVLHPDNS